MMSIPDDFVGLWRRLSLTDYGGRDETTVVFYLQTKSGIFADIRIPATVLGVRSDPANAEEALALSFMKGFAGTFTCDYSTSICKWIRELDFQPTPEQFLPDESTFSFRDRDILIETGIHEAFEEVWSRMTEFGQPSYAFRCCSRSGILVVIEPYYICAFARSSELPKAPSLKSLMLQSVKHGKDFLDMVIEYGELPTKEDGDWMVVQSTKRNCVDKPSCSVTTETWSSVHDCDNSFMPSYPIWWRSLHIINSC